MSEDTVTALFRATVVVARSEGEETAYRAAAQLVADLQGLIYTLTVRDISYRLDAIRTELEVQANAARHIHTSVQRRIQRAGMELRDDTSPR